MGRPAVPTVRCWCAQCGVEFEHKPYQPRKFCSRRCFDLSGLGGRKPAVSLTFECDTCGKLFQRKSYKEAERALTRSDHGKSGDFCSRACYLAPRKDRERVRQRRLAATRAWRKKAREHVKRYKREAYYRAGTADGPTREYAAILRFDPCSYCGGVADTFDHIQPITKGGQNHWTNLTRACRACNTRKSNRSLLEHLYRSAA